MASSSSAAASAEVKPNTKALLAAIKQLAPPLSLHSHKGQSGRVGVIGGSKAYTGAPYFSAQCCLSMGADLVTLFCSVEAALAIKAYSPDLMVRPTLFPAYKAQEATAELDAAAAGGDGKDKEKDKGKSLVERLADDIEQWSAKLDVQVLGPGLGKDELISQTVGAWIVKQSRKGEGSGSSDAKEKEKQQPSPLVIDGDGIHVFQHYTSGRATHASAFNAHVVLTPNAAEFRRLWQHFVGEGEKGTATAAAAMPLPNFDVDANDQWLKDSQLFRTADARGRLSAVTCAASLFLHPHGSLNL
jgi:ATP-dependent NAD(P)H-hydrate dehydratase